MTEIPGLDVAGLTGWLQRAHPDLAGGDLEAHVIAGGKSNLTYRIDGARIPLVLRRPPLGHVLASAHDMRREHRVISALRGSRGAGSARDRLRRRHRGGRGHRHALLRDGASSTGTCSTRPPQNAQYTADGLRAREPRTGRASWPSCTRSIPQRVGLGDFGRGDGFLDRQLRPGAASSTRRARATSRRSTACRTASRERMPDIRPVHASCTATTASTTRSSTGRATTARISAILDWEMATLGDPLVDLGMFGLYWNIGALPGGCGRGPERGRPGRRLPGVRRTGRRVFGAGRASPSPTSRWYARSRRTSSRVILEGIHFRFSRGETVGAGFDRIGALVEPLAGEGLRQLASGRR